MIPDDLREQWTKDSDAISDMRQLLHTHSGNLYDETWTRMTQLLHFTYARSDKPLDPILDDILPAAATKHHLAHLDRSMRFGLKHAHPDDTLLDDMDFHKGDRVKRLAGAVPGTVTSVDWDTNGLIPVLWDGADEWSERFNLWRPGQIRKIAA